MVVEWMSPLVTSAIRLVVITMLFTGNCGAVCRIFMLPKYKGLLSHKWITILTILILNLLYLSVIWAPFTITTFKYNLQDLQDGHKPAEGVEQRQAPSTYILEYLANTNGTLVQETKLGTVMWEANPPQMILPEGNGPQDSTTNQFDHLRKFENDVVPPPSAEANHSRLGDSLNHWITHVQDLVTSSFTYSLILLIVVRRIMTEKGVVMGKALASMFSVLLSVLLIPLTLTTRQLAHTINQFALHTSEVSKSGYTMYSIICDVSITQSYVVGLYLECAVVLLVAALLLVVTQKYTNHPLTSAEDDGHGSVQVEEVACRCVLLLGGVWAWPLKPLLVTILFCIHGTHWSNVVCWLANMVVAIPVVFMPLAVFLSRPEDPDTTSGYGVFVNDPETTEDGTEKHHVDKCTEMEVEDICCNIACENMARSGKLVVSSGSLEDVPQKGKQAQENLKFYLGTDLFKPKKEDEVCILDQSCVSSDGNESVV